MNGFGRIFNPDQMKKIQDPKKYLRWLPETIQEALQMYVKLGSKGYNDLIGYSYKLLGKLPRL